MRAKLIRDDCEKVWTEPLRSNQTIQTVNSITGKHMALLLKLHEETDEISRDATNPTEYADLLEVMIELARINGVRWASIEKALLAKRAERGGFRLGKVWTEDVPRPPPYKTKPLPNTCRIKPPPKTSRIKPLPAHEDRSETPGPRPNITLGEIADKVVEIARARLIEAPLIKD